MTQRHCLLIAPLVSHATAGRIAALVSTDFSVSLLDVSARDVKFSVDQYPFNKLKRIHPLRATRDGYLQNWRHADQLKDTLRSRGMVAEDGAVMESLRGILRSDKPDVVLTYYGPIGLHFARLVKRIDRRLKVVFIANLAPSTILSGGAFARAIKSPMVPEFVDYSVWLKELDFVVSASEEMSEYLRSQYSISPERMAVLPDFLPSTFQAGGNVPSDAGSEKAGVNSRVIFLGAPERWGGEIDRLDTEFERLESANVDVYASSNDATRPTSAHSYPYFSDDEVFSGKLSEFATRFDAALVLYNRSQRHERFRSTLPTRFFSSLAAGLPIVVKSGMFDAVESFVRKHSIGCTFDSAEQLHGILAEKRKLLEYRENVRRLMPMFGAESQAEKLQSILEAVLRR